MDGRRMDTPSSSALLLAFLMLLAPLATAATVNTFSDGETEVSIEMRDPIDYTNSEDGIVRLPAGETVTSASVTAFADPIAHAWYTNVDSTVNPNVWDPAVNNLKTSVSSTTDLVYQNEVVKLRAEGFTTDFEGTNAGFLDQTPAPLPFGWEHTFADSSLQPSSCASGEECMATQMFDQNYRDDNGEDTFRYEMRTPAVQVLPTGAYLRASSWHSLFYNISTSGGTPVNYYYDCAYMMIRNASSPTQFPPPDLQSSWTVLPIDIQNSSMNYGSGIHQVGGGAARIQSCNGVPTNSYALGGESKTINNPGGWQTLAANLQDHIGRYIEIKFVLSREGNPTGDVSPEEPVMPGWVIDNLRIGPTLPQSASITVRNFGPRLDSTSPASPNGFGVLAIEAETAATNSLTVDVLSSFTGAIAVDDNGRLMAGLTGPIIELWDVNSSTYQQIDLRFNFNSGGARLSTPVLHGFNLGTRVGTSFHDLSLATGVPDSTSGTWSVTGDGLPVILRPELTDVSGWSGVNDVDRYAFSLPISAITPRVDDSCSNLPLMRLEIDDGRIVNLTDGTTYRGAPFTGYSTIVSYIGEACDVDAIWFDLEFLHHAEGLTLDVAGDGDIEWGFDEPAFGTFGRQQVFWDAIANGVNLGAEDRTVSLSSVGFGQGGNFMIPRDATIGSATFGMDQPASQLPATAFDLSLELKAAGQSVALGTLANAGSDGSNGFHLPEQVISTLDLGTAIQTLIDNPSVPTSHTDAYGNEWVNLYFSVDAPEAPSGHQVRFRNLDVHYEMDVLLSNPQNLARELSQGVALGTGTTVDVPIVAASLTGGAVGLRGLNVNTVPGYAATITPAPSLTGLYPDGSIHQVTTTHAIEGSTGTTLDQARLRIESSSGTVEFGYSDVNGFTEVEDPDALVTLEASSVTDTADGKEIVWRFSTTSNWGDSAEVRMYASSIGANGVHGLPAAHLLDPMVGNAIENDIQMTTFQLLNTEAEVQNLDAAQSNQRIRLVGSVMLENLMIAPDPSSYRLILQEEDVNTSGAEPVSTWHDVHNVSGPIGGDFDMIVDLGVSAAGASTYRFGIFGYEGGTTLCPSLDLRPDDACFVPFNLTIDTYAPSIDAIDVLIGSNPAVEEAWRSVVDDTWVVPSASQTFRIRAQDLPIPPTALQLNYWVELDHDTNQDGRPQADEYRNLSMPSDGSFPFANYSGSFNDRANDGQEGLVSLYITGADLAGNVIDGGGPGIDHDLVTYISMGNSVPRIDAMTIETSSGIRLIDDASAPGYEGFWNYTAFAGNTYYVVLEGQDLNGWRDVERITVELNPDDDGDGDIYFSPRNGTAWTTSSYLSVPQSSDDDRGARITDRDGMVLVDPFQTTFVARIPVIFDWAVDAQELSLSANGVSNRLTPRVGITDLSGASGGVGTITEYQYSSAIRLDLVSVDFEDRTEPLTNDVEVGFVRAGDTVRFSGDYAFVAGLPDASILPEVNLTMEITRQAAQTDATQGYTAYPGETTVHTFSGGTFDIDLLVPPVTNVFTYDFRLIDLPQGAIDGTEAFCTDRTENGCSSFRIKVDSNLPIVSDNSWTASVGVTNDLMVDTLPSSSLDCIDLQVNVREREQLLSDEVRIEWRAYASLEPEEVWPVWTQVHGAAPLSTAVELSSQGSSYAITADCVDLWPDADELTSQQINDNPIFVFRMAGTDSAGWAIDDSQMRLVTTQPQHNSQYRLEFEEPEISVVNVVMNPTSPRAFEPVTLDLLLRNSGTLAGNTTLIIQSVIGGSNPVEVQRVTTEEIPIGAQVSLRVTLDPFQDTVNGVSYQIIDANSDALLWDGSTVMVFNVGVAASEGPGANLTLILALLGGVVVVLLLVVVALVLRSRDDEDYDDYEDDKDLVAIPRGESNLAPASGYGAPASGYGAGPAAQTGASGYGPAVTPEMEQALREFPQWDQTTIQGYFDMGWSVDQLRDWVRENQG